MNIDKQQSTLIEEKKGFWAWVKAHKKQLIAAGVSIALIAAVVVGLKNKNALMAVWHDLNERLLKGAKAPVSKTVKVVEQKPLEAIKPACEIIDFPKQRVYDAPFNVSEHVRNLPAGKHPSAEKVAIALEHGIDLEPGQTLVEAYVKGLKTA